MKDEVEKRFAAAERRRQARQRLADNALTWFGRALAGVMTVAIVPAVTGLFYGLARFSAWLMDASMRDTVTLRDGYGMERLVERGPAFGVALAVGVGVVAGLVVAGFSVSYWVDRWSK